MNKRTFEGSEIAGSKKQKVLEKGHVWMWLFEIFEEYDGRGANGDSASIEVLIKDKKKVKEAATYGWIDIEEDELHLEPEVESMEMEVLTEDFYLDLECVTDEEFLKKWKDELKELREIFEGSEEEESEEEEEEEEEESEEEESEEEDE